MEPAIMAGDWLWIDKFSYGGILPERWADIPLLNVFTYNTFLRNLDAQIDWGYHRLPGFGKPQVGDIVIFKSPEDRETLLVKRVAEIYYSGKNRYYYCLGDNSENSHDSRAFGYVPEELIVGKGRKIINN
jgi:signal peptidase I